MNIKPSDLLLLKEHMVPRLTSGTTDSLWLLVSKPVPAFSHICLLLISKPTAEESCHQMNFICEYKPATLSFGPLPGPSSDFGQRKRHNFCSECRGSKKTRQEASLLHLTSITFLLCYCVTFYFKLNGFLSNLRKQIVNSFEYPLILIEGFSNCPSVVHTWKVKFHHWALSPQEISALDCTCSTGVCSVNSSQYWL